MLSHGLGMLYFLSFTSSFFSSVHGDIVGPKVLTFGKELWEETLLLQMHSGLYKLQGLKPNTWHEVKISYPASKEGSSFGMNLNRRLLNTEKLIFKTDSLTSKQRNLYILVSVEPEGIVAIPNVSERRSIVFNIVCDELLMGIPHKAWLVVVLVLICLGLEIIIPRYLVPHMMLFYK